MWIHFAAGLLYFVGYRLTELSQRVLERYPERFVWPEQVILLSRSNIISKSVRDRYITTKLAKGKVSAASPSVISFNLLKPEIYIMYHQL